MKKQQINRKLRAKMTKDTRKTLVETTHELLVNRPRPVTFRSISESIDVSISWLESFSASRVVEPGCNSIQKLYEFLSGQKLNY